MTERAFEIAPRTAEALGWPDLLARLSDLCHTDRAKEAAVALPFRSTVEAVEHELALVAEARALHDKGDPMPFGSVFDLRIPLRRLEKEGMLEGPTLVQVAETLRAGARLRRFLLGRSSTAPNLAAVAGRLRALEDVSGPIADSFDEHGVLADHASRDLGRLRKRRLDLHERLSRRMRNLMDKPSISKHLQDRFYTQREDRFVLPIRSDAGPAVEGIVHGSSASGATMFVEPREVVGLNNELKVAEMEVTREEARILTELSSLVGEEWQPIWDNLLHLEELDLIDARARLAVRLDAHPARAAGAPGRLELHGMRHPLMVLAGMEVVPNDLILEPGSTLIVSGPNAGGKTVSLKTLGLCALMQRAGMHLPAGPDGQMPLFADVLTEMGDDQSIEHSLSTFTAHLTHLLRFLDAASPDTLILLDEIAVGTDPGEGAALARSVLEGFAGAGASVVVTTHYEQLKGIPIDDERFANASVGFDMTRMSPTYRLHMGLPGSSGAIAVARRVGLPEGLALRAEALLQGGGHEMARLLAAVADQRTKLVEQQEELARATSEARRSAARHEAELQRLRDRQEQAVQTEFNAALDELKRARKELSQVRAQLKRPPSRERLDQADRQISHASGAILRHEPREEPRGRPASVEDLVPGARVVVNRLGGQGEVMETPSRGRVAVRVGGLRTQVAVEDVLLPEGKTPEKKTEKRAERRPDQSSGRPSPAAPDADALPARETPIRTPGNTLDLRGMRVHEALSSVDKALDDALRAGEEVLFVIHGHGTGALRTALREHLPGHPLVERYEAGAPREGGDGVTVVFLK
jgi:DNA mismatch repair protein MutS2